MPALLEDREDFAEIPSRDLPRLTASIRDDESIMTKLYSSVTRATDGVGPRHSASVEPPTVDELLTSALIAIVRAAVGEVEERSSSSEEARPRTLPMRRDVSSTIQLPCGCSRMRAPARALSDA
jgi:hypothetical protein